MDALLMTLHKGHFFCPLKNYDQTKLCSESRISVDLMKRYDVRLVETVTLPLCWIL